MGQSNEIITWLINLFTNNPPFVLAMFILSVMANLIQVGTYFREQRRLKSEQIERNKLAQLVSTYEDVLKIAKETVQDKDKLEKLKDEIQASSSKATLLTEEIKQLEKAAQRKLITQTIEYNRNELTRLYNEINDLQSEYKDIGELPNISPENKKAIESQVELALRKPYEFPREFVFTSTLLVLFLMFLPWPVDTLLLPFLIRYFIIAFFEAVWLYPNRRVQSTIVKYHSPIVFFAYFGVWFQFFSAIETLIQPLLNSVLATQYGNPALSIPQIQFIGSISPIVNALPLPLAFILAMGDWRFLRNDIREKSLDKIRVALSKSDNVA